MCRVLISGYYGYNNAGDEAILQSMVSEFRKVYSDIDIVVLSANPSKTAQLYNIKAISRNNLLHIFSEIKKCDLLISGGGSLFQDATSLFSPWYYSSIIMMAHFLKKPVFAYAQGIGPINNHFNKKLLKCIMNWTYGISVRDKRSLNELKSFGIKREISCTIDPAFLIESASKDESRKILQKENQGKDLARPKIGFSVRTWKGSVDVASIFADVADKVSREFGADIVLFPLYYETDLKLAEDIAEKMQSSVVIIREECSPAQLIGLYGLMDINVCIRFHGLVFSAMNGIPMVAISYDPKIDSFMDYLGVNNVLKYKELDSQSVFDAIKMKWLDRENLSVQIDSKGNEFKALAQKGIDEITQLIKMVEKKKRARLGKQELDN